jgi:hypothetical protein
MLVASLGHVDGPNTREQTATDLILRVTQMTINVLRSRAPLILLLFGAAVAAAVASWLPSPSDDDAVQAAIKAKARVASAAPASADDALRRAVLGVWQDDYQGARTLVVRPDGTATMTIEFDGWKARMFTPRLRIETTWHIENAQFERQTVGGQPPDKVEFVKRRVGDRASDRIVEITGERMVLVDQDGETRYEWRRVNETALSRK